MDRFKLNYHQIIGLMTYGLGVIVQNLIENSLGLTIIFFGLLVFLLSSKSNIGIIISLIAVAIGYLAKIIHFPYGNEIILFGYLGFLVSIFFKHIYKSYKLDIVLIYISITIFIIGIYFKITHINYALELIFIGATSVSISYAYRFIKKTPKYFEDYNKMLLVFFWSLSTIFNVFHWPYGTIVWSIFMLTLWVWLIKSMIRELK